MVLTHLQEQWQFHPQPYKEEKVVTPVPAKGCPYPEKFLHYYHPDIKFYIKRTSLVNSVPLLQSLAIKK